MTERTAFLAFFTLVEAAFLLMVVGLVAFVWFLVRQNRRGRSSR